MLWLPEWTDARFHAETGSDSSLFSIYASGSPRMASLFLLGFLTTSCEIASPPKRKSETDQFFWRNGCVRVLGRNGEDTSGRGARLFAGERALAVSRRLGLPFALTGPHPIAQSCARFYPEQ